VSEPGAPDADVRAGLLAAYLLGLALARHLVQLPPIAALDDGRRHPFVADTVHRILVDPLPTPEPERGATAQGQPTR